MKKHIYLIAFGFFLAIAPPGIILAQPHNFSVISYNPSIPTGKLADFTDQTSFRGFNAEFRVVVNDNFTLGISGGLNTFRQASDGIVSEVIERNGKVITLSAKRYRYTNMVPVLLTGYYYLGSMDTHGVKPYIGTGLGGYYIRKTVQMGLYQSDQEKIQFGLAPAAGILMSSSEHVVFMLEVQYHNVFGTAKSDPASAVGFKIGIGGRL